MESSSPHEHLKATTPQELGRSAGKKKCLIRVIMGASKEQMLTSQGLGHACGRKARRETRQGRALRKLAVILHRIWIAGTDFQPKPA
jgi:hypothetical protein